MTRKIRAPVSSTVITNGKLGNSKMVKSVTSSIFLSLLLTTIVIQVCASTGNLRGACKKVVEERFPEAEIIGMTGGVMMDFNVSGFLVDKNGTPHHFLCFFPYSHGEPSHFKTMIYGEDKKDPVADARKAFEHQQERFERELELNRQMKIRRQQVVEEHKASQKQQHKK